MLRKKTKRMTASIIGLGLALVLTGCSNEVNRAIKSGDELFAKGDYPAALDAYGSIEDDVEGKEALYKTIFDRAIELYELGEYSESRDYFVDVLNAKELDSDAIGNYISLCDAYKSIQAGYDALMGASNVLYMSGKGFEPATEALESGAFDKYIPLAKAAGMYKSERTLEHYSLVPGTTMILGGVTECHSYISIGSEINATTLASDGAVVEMTNEKVKERAASANFSCHISALDGETDKWHCWADYTDQITGEENEISFDLTLDGASLVVSSLKSDEEAGDQTFVEGRYIKVE